MQGAAPSSSSTSFRPPAHTVERQLKTTSNARRTQFAAFSAVRSSLYCVCLIISAVDLRNDSGNSTSGTNFELESGDPCGLQVQKLWEAQRRSPAAPGCVSRSGSASRCIPRLSSPLYSICCNRATLFSIPSPAHESYCFMHRVAPKEAAFWAGPRKKTKSLRRDRD